MPRFRKKPVEIEATLNDGDTAAIIEWLGSLPPAEIGGGQGLDYHVDGTITVQTLEGPLKAGLGDWIICGVKGELYPCKPDIFAATYEEAGASPDTPSEAWQGEPPAEGTRRSLIRDTIAGGIVGAHLSDGALLQVVDEIEIALQSADEQPEDPYAGAEAIEANEAGEV